MEMLRRMLVLGGVATAHMAALHAHAQVDPTVPHLQAFLATARVGPHVMDVIEMCTGRHDVLFCALHREQINFLDRRSFS